MSGFNCIEKILESLPGDRIGVSREIIRHFHDATARRILRKGCVLAIQEFSLDESKIRSADLVKEEGENVERIKYGPYNLAHCYDLSVRFGSGNSVYVHHETKDYISTKVHRVSSTFDDVCMAQSAKFTESLKPGVSYKIVTPVMVIQIPGNSSRRDYLFSPGNYHPTDHTTIVTEPSFKTELNPNVNDILSVIQPNQTTHKSIIYHLEQSANVLRAVTENPEFQRLTSGLVELSKQIDHDRDVIWRATPK